jgi:hypothetical protein
MVDASSSTEDSAGDAHPANTATARTPAKILMPGTVETASEQLVN